MQRTSGGLRGHPVVWAKLFIHGGAQITNNKFDVFRTATVRLGGQCYIGGKVDSLRCCKCTSARNEVMPGRANDRFNPFFPPQPRGRWSKHPPRGKKAIVDTAGVTASVGHIFRTERRPLGARPWPRPNRGLGGHCAHFQASSSKQQAASKQQASKQAQPRAALPRWGGPQRRPPLIVLPISLKQKHVLVFLSSSSPSLFFFFLLSPFLLPVLLPVPPFFFFFFFFFFFLFVACGLDE